MPLEMSAGADYIMARFFGAVSPADLQALADQTHTMEERLQVPNRLTDLTAVERFEFDFTAVSALAERRRAVRFQAPIRSAIIAVAPVAIGFSRMFQTLNDNPQIEIRIVSSREEAEVWFGEA
jgi:hypothetical protein